jgi:hypothetical protein
MPFLFWMPLIIMSGLFSVALEPGPQPRQGGIKRTPPLTDL